MKQVLRYGLSPTLSPDEKLTFEQPRVNACSLGKRHQSQDFIKQSRWLAWLVLRACTTAFLPMAMSTSGVFETGQNATLELNKTF